MAYTDPHIHTLVVGERGHVVVILYFTINFRMDTVNFRTDTQETSLANYREWVGE